MRPRRDERSPGWRAHDILKDNISCTIRFPARTARPGRWRDHPRAQERGSHDISCVQNKTVVTNAFKGEDLNHYVPLFKKYEIPFSTTSVRAT